VGIDAPGQTTDLVKYLSIRHIDFAYVALLIWDSETNSVAVHT